MENKKAIYKNTKPHRASWDTLPIERTYIHSNPLFYATGCKGDLTLNENYIGEHAAFPPFLYPLPELSQDFLHRKTQYIVPSWYGTTPKEVEIKLFDLLGSRVVGNDCIKIELNGEFVCQFEMQFRDLEKAINESKYILDFEDNFDGEGSEGYSKETWVKAVTFLVKQFQSFHNRFKKILPSPNIFHGPDGSIDLYWKKEGKAVLLNIPKEKAEKATFSATNITGDEIRGYIVIDNINESLIYTIASFI